MYARVHRIHTQTQQRHIHTQTQQRCKMTLFILEFVFYLFEQ